MKRNATVLLTMLLLLLPAVPAQAQDEPQQVTVRDLNAIAQDDIDQLNQLGAELSEEQIEELIFNDLVGQRVQFTAVVLSNPRNSGLSTPNDETGLPSRVSPTSRRPVSSSPGAALAVPSVVIVGRKSALDFRSSVCPAERSVGGRRVGPVRLAGVATRTGRSTR